MVQKYSIIWMILSKDLICWAFPQGEGPKVPSTMFERNLFLNPVIRIKTVIMVFVDIKIASIVTGGCKVPKAKGLFN